MEVAVVVGALLMTFTAVAMAQQGNGGGAAAGSGSGVGTGSGTMQQDRDQLQVDDPQMDQDRDQLQDQDQLRDGTGDGVPDQDRTQTQDQDRIHVDSTDALHQYIQEQQQTRLQDKTTATGTQAGMGMQVQSRVEAQVAADVVQAAEPLLGANGPRMSAVAAQVSQATQALAQNEQQLETRSRVQLFLFGQDDEVVAEMEQVMEQQQTRIEEMKQLMLDCTDCDQGATETLLAQIQNMEQEQARLQTVVDDADSRTGLFGFLFGWLR